MERYSLEARDTNTKTDIDPVLNNQRLKTANDTWWWCF